MNSPDPHVIEQHGPYVRRIKTDPLTIACQELVNNMWTTFQTFDEMSDDYAYTNSAAACRRVATKYIGKRLCALRDEDAAYDAELARVRREHMLAQDYADLELRVLANDAAYVAAMERAYPHLKGED